MPEKAVTVQDALRTGAERLALREDLRDFARQDAQQLLEIATGLKKAHMLAHPERPVNGSEAALFEQLLQKRLQAVPIQYLRGFQEFYGRDFQVSPAVLIPRPETEGIVTAALELVGDRNRGLHIADVGTGSGAIALTLGLEFPNSTVTAIDLSNGALQVAQQNATRLAREYDPTLTHRIRFLQSDLFAAVATDTRYDLIVSNPPYIPLTECDGLHSQVRDHEPHLALFGGHDGYDIYRRLISDAWHKLYNGGCLILETAGSLDLLHTMLSKWSGVDSRPDLLGRPRVLIAVRP